VKVGKIIIIVLRNMLIGWLKIAQKHVVNVNLQLLRHALITKVILIAMLGKQKDIVKLEIIVILWLKIAQKLVENADYDKYYNLI